MGRRRPPATLAVFVQSLEGSRVVVELRRDTVVRGTLVAADEGLNLQLADATVRPLGGAPRAASVLHVRGRSVRYIHLPANLDPAAAVEAHRRKVAQALRAHAAEQGAAQRLPKGGQLEVGAQGGTQGAAGAMDTR
jgi:small nuclear ribonucleoprotein (snRNP)-like protein